MPGGGRLNRSRPKLGCSATEEEKTMPREQIPKGKSRKKKPLKPFWSHSMYTFPTGLTIRCQLRPKFFLRIS